MRSVSAGMLAVSKGMTVCSQGISHVSPTMAMTVGMPAQIM